MSWFPRKLSFENLIGRTINRRAITGCNNSNPNGSPNKKRRSSSDDEANRTFEGMDIENYEYPKKVWSTPMKKVRNKAAEVKKDWDKKFYGSHDSASAKYFTKDEFEYDRSLENELQQGVQNDPALQDVFQGLTLKVLAPEDYRLLTRNGHAYCIGKGEHAKVFIAENVQTKELVCIKAFLEQVPRKDLFAEIGYFHRGQAILSQDPDYVPLYFRGFLKLKQNSRLKQEFDDLMIVTTVASLVPNVPVCLSLDTAIDLLEQDNIELSASEWAGITYRLIKAVALFHKGSLKHGDLHAGNVFLTYTDGLYKLGIIDFGFAQCDWTEHDLTKVLESAQYIADLSHMDSTSECVDSASVSVGMDNIIPDMDTLLEELHAALSEDVDEIK